MIAMHMITLHEVWPLVWLAKVCQAARPAIAMANGRIGDGVWQNLVVAESHPKPDDMAIYGSLRQFRTF